MNLPFLDRRGGQIALIDAHSGKRLSYDELHELVTSRSVALGISGGVAVILCRNSVETIIDYLSALTAGLAVIPLDAEIDSAKLAHILGEYSPEWVLGTTSENRYEGFTQVEVGRLESNRRGALSPICGDLAILLSTSGSTGSPKMVRLTADNIGANTLSISSSLRLTEEDRAITTMPLHYSYGLSVLNTHLSVGASIVVSNASVVDKEFWAAIKDYSVTSFAGVPYTFAMLKRLGYSPADTPTVTKVTQAGGKLDSDSIAHFNALFQSNGIQFFIMYGQTEAGPRISCLPPERLDEKLGSAGVVMSGGQIHIGKVGSRGAVDDTGEIIYVGPNVMLGYASSRADLTCDDVNRGVLHTGDIGYLDDEGFLFITGRLKRIAKLFGSRVSLDEVETLLSSLGPVAAVGGDDKLYVHHQCTDLERVAVSRKDVSLKLRVPLASVHMHFEADFPVLPNGKVDYRTLSETHSPKE